MSTGDTKSSEETSRRVPLGKLHPNDYNPRKSMTNIDALAESIDQDGLLQSLAVRPMEGGEFEVIAGMRRLAALEQLYDDDHMVSVEVHDVDDDTAARIALKENMERENLTKMEEAWAFARAVEVKWCGDCGEIVRNGHDGSTGHSVIVKPYSDIINESPLAGIPTKDHPGVKSLADDLPDTSGGFIRDRLSFVTLPDEVQDMVEDEDLTVRAARMLARLSIPDPEEREQSIRSIVDDLPDRMKDADYNDLKEAIESEEQDYRERKELAQEAVEEYSELVDQRRETLKEDLEKAAEAIDEDVDITADDDELVETADELADELEAEAGKARMKVSDIADEQDALDVKIERTTKALMNYDQEHGECGYCGSEVARDVLEERRGGLREERDELDDRRTELQRSASEYEDHRRALNMDRRGLVAAREEYNSALDRAEAANAD